MNNLAYLYPMVIDYRNKEMQPSCYGCGLPTQNQSILICADCLGDECEQFLSLAKKMNEDDLEKDEE